MPPNLTTKWERAEYYRLRRMPEKKCRVCQRSLKNTDEFFARGKKSMLTSTCLRCYEQPPAKAALVAHDAKDHQQCPVCFNTARLVKDPHGYMVCKRCIMVANVVCSAETPEGAGQMLRYAEWRRSEKDCPSPNT